MTHIDYTFTLEVRDVPGMLVRITQVFARRGCNIQSLHVQPKKRGLWSVIVVEAYDVARPDQLQHHLEKLIDVHQVQLQKYMVKDGPS